MRVSTSMIYDRGVATIQQQTAQLLQTQQQVSSGRRILTPADDPIGAARALEVTQSQAINAQFMTNQGYAADNLNLLENRLVGVGDIFQYARERAVQAGSGSLSETDLGFIATDLRAQFDGLLALANSQDANNEFLFAGYKSQTQPFSGGFGGVTYDGDQGVRTIQVSASRFMPISQPGSEVFGKTQPISNDLLQTGSGDNAGTGALSAGFIGGFPASEADLALLGRRLEINAVDDGAGGVAYNVYALSPGEPRETIGENLASLDVLSRRNLLPPDENDPNPLFVGLELAVAPPPQVGDTFEVFVGSPDVFSNLAVFVDALERPGPSGMAGGAVDFALRTLDAGLDNVLRVRAQVGSQLVEVERLQNVGGDLDLQYAQTLSRLQDVDFAEAISNLTRQQTFLEAAQASFVRVTGLSLFNFIN